MGRIVWPNNARALRHYTGLARQLDRQMREWGLDPDGPPKGLPPRPAQFREYEAAPTDFVGALYRPYVPPV